MRRIVQASNLAIANGWFAATFTRLDDDDLAIIDGGIRAKLIGLARNIL
jgi:hypothetical protein